MVVCYKDTVVGIVHENIDFLEQVAGHIQFLHHAIRMHGLMQDHNRAVSDAADCPRVDIAYHLSVFQVDDITASAMD